MYQILRYVRYSVAIIVILLSLCAFFKNFYPVPFFDIEGIALIQRVIIHGGIAAFTLLAAILILTLLFGRIYCACLCPFGLYQEFLMGLFRRRMVYRNNKAYKYFLTALVFGFLFGGTIFAARFLDPYTLFGSAMSGAWLGLAAFLIVAVLTFWKGRLFCTDICPLGTILGLISKYALFQIYIDENKCRVCGLCARHCPTGSIDFKKKYTNNETCVKCLKCVTVCPFKAMKYHLKPKKIVAFNPQRRQLIISAMSLGVLIAAAKGGAVWVKNTAQKFKNIIVPPGASSADDFANRCLNCNLCVQNCPMKILKKATQEYPAVHVDYSNSFCGFDCHQCAKICPSGALRKLSLEEKRRTKIGTAYIDESKCVKCGLCVLECPRTCILKEEGAFPHVTKDSCIGCGACKVVCPVQAIKIQPVEKQSTVSILEKKEK